MAISEGYKHNFGTLKRAFGCGDCALVECMDAATHKPVYVVCAVQEEDDGGCTMIPLAKLFDGNPYEEILSPLQMDEMGLEIP